MQRGEVCHCQVRKVEQRSVYLGFATALLQLLLPLVHPPPCAEC